MDLNSTAEEEQYRAQVRAWLEANLPQRARSKAGTAETGLERARAWQRKVFEAGYLALGWPKEYGGQALDPMRPGQPRHRRPDGSAARRSRVRSQVPGMGMSQACEPLSVVQIREEIPQASTA
jgi:alkylation response protein AidB-like acyl-CoA dehydrogenase